MKKILVINPGSTSTKIAIFFDREEKIRETLIHDDSLLSQPLFPQQYEERKKSIFKFIQDKGFSLGDFSAIAARGGRLKPVKSGVYRINEEMVEHARIGLQGQHPANIAVVLAWEISKKYGCDAFTVDPISVDEMMELAKVTGVKGIRRNSLSHALNMKAVAKKAARDIGKSYEQSRFIVVHLGGGGSISAHLDGKMVDLYNSDKEGPFAVERAGNIPTLDLLDYMKENNLNFDEIIQMLTHKGGLFSHFGTRNMSEILKEAEKNPKNMMIIEAYIYNVSKYACSLLPIFNGQLDAIVVTGGVVKNEFIRELLKKYLSFLKIMWYPGEFEMETLALRTLDALEGREEILEY